MTVRSIGPMVLVLCACAAEQDTSGPDSVSEQSALHETAMASSIDSAPSVAAELDLATGRSTKIPVSWYWRGGTTFTGAHDLVFRATCGTEDTVHGRCDTGLLVSYAGRTQYNDDDPMTAGGKGSRVDPPAQKATIAYSLLVFSRLRATSRTNIEYSRNGGNTWIRLSGTDLVNVGGTLVKVGALASGDAIEVQTRSNGAGNDDTSLTLFNTDNATTRPTTFINDISTTDRDPRIFISDSSWADPDNYVVIGKSNRSTASLSGTETRVDLVHTPLSIAGQLPLVCSDGPCYKVVPAGRYLFYVFATIASPIGHYTTANTRHLSGNMPVLGADGCPNDARDGQGDATWYRGTPNDIAYTVTVQTNDFNSWKTVATRKITRAAFGSGPGEGWNKFAVQVDVPFNGIYRVLTTKHVSGITEFADWRHERNPEATEVKVVAYNTLYISNSFDTNKYKNVANLVGTRGRIYSSSFEVEERLDQAPFQWEADVLAFQEMEKEGSDNDPGNKYSDIVRAELDARSSLRWTYSQGRGETWTGGFGDGPGMSPVFVNSNFYPGASNTGVYFSSAAKSAAGCSDDGGNAYYGECHLSEQGLGDGDIVNYATAARFSAWRGGTDDRPVAVFNVHMEASDGPKDFAPRVGELRTLIDKIKKLLSAQHTAFNRAPSSATDRASPKHYQNRIIILGDWNIRAHECGEHYWMLRMLRQQFGYAIDVGMAMTNSSGDLRQGMHVATGGYLPSDVPANYQHMWTTDPRNPFAWIGWQKDPNYSSSSRFPWWATDWRDKTTKPNKAGERLSMIALVGKGWAYDDPALSYAVMADSSYVSPMNPEGRGVEMYKGDCGDPGSVPFSSQSYAPTYSLGCDGFVNGGTSPGAPAVHSDHRPMGARLRIWSR